MEREFGAKERDYKEQMERDLMLMQNGNGGDHDELRREVSRLNEELEKFKGKYFDGEQRKIELSDQLDEIKEEKFKMEEKLEELAAEVARYKEMMERDNFEN